MKLRPQYINQTSMQHTKLQPIISQQLAKI